jgi:hypothetical protein
MQSNTALVWALGIVATGLSLSLSAAQPANSDIEFLRPSDLSKSPSQVPGSAHGHVRQRLEYGKGYRYGHSVNGPLGDIIIWSAAPNKSHDSMQIMQPGIQQRPRTMTVTVPQLQFKPGYGKTSNPDYGD